MMNCIAYTVVVIIAWMLLTWFPDAAFSEKLTKLSFLKLSERHAQKKKKKKNTSVFFVSKSSGSGSDIFVRQGQKKKKCKTKTYSAGNTKHNTKLHRFTQREI